MNTYMTSLVVENRDGKLVVDSRLVAEELGIEHKTLKETIRNHETELTFGCKSELLSETLKGKPLPQGGLAKGEVIYWLSEDQATFVMTLSRNTPQVIQAKLHLVNAFSAAKKALTSVSPELLKLLGFMTEQMNILTARTQRLDEIDKATNNNKGIKGVIDIEVENTYPDELELTVREYLDYKVVGLVHLNKMRKRAIQFYRQETQEEELPKKGNEVVFKGNAIAYLDQALKTVLELD